MIFDEEVYRPVRIAGIFFICVSFFAEFFFNITTTNEPFELSFRIFVAINIVIYLLMGFGILYKKLWGYYLLKLYLYFLVLGFPIGTYIGVKSLRYLRENKVKEILEKK